MPLTEEQKAFHRRKLKTRFMLLDVNRRGYISVEDWHELARRFVEYGKLTGEAEKRLKKRIQVLHAWSYSLVLHSGYNVGVQCWPAYHSYRVSGVAWNNFSGSQF